MGKKRQNKSKTITSQGSPKKCRSPTVTRYHLRSSLNEVESVPNDDILNKKNQALKEKATRLKKNKAVKKDKEQVEDVEKEDINEIHNSSTSQTSIQPDIISDPSYSLIDNYDIILYLSKFSLYSLIKIYKHEKGDYYCLYLHNSNERNPSIQKFPNEEESIKEFTRIVQERLNYGFSITEKEDIPELREENHTIKEQEVKPLIKYVTDVQAIKKQIAYRNYNNEKLPLGSISKDTIVEGYNILKKIYDILSKKENNNEELYNLSMIFYSIIPHHIQFNGSFQFITINGINTVIQKINLLYSLDVINSLVYYNDNSLLNLLELSQQLTTLHDKSYLIQVIPDFLKKNGLKLIEIYTISPEIQTTQKLNIDILNESNVDKKRVLLWKGCYIEEAWKILIENTLQRKLNTESKWIEKIPPFGNNIVLYDNPQIAIMNNCCPLYQNEAILFLCETDLTDMRHIYNYDDPSTNKIYREAEDIIKLEGINTYETPQKTDDVILYTEECKNKNEVRNI